jgi:hypothetical protein
VRNKVPSTSASSFIAHAFLRALRVSVVRSFSLDRQFAEVPW